jgi:hypothetical protein
MPRLTVLHISTASFPFLGIYVHVLGKSTQRPRIYQWEGLTQIAECVCIMEETGKAAGGAADA